MRVKAMSAASLERWFGQKCIVFAETEDAELERIRAEATAACLFECEKHLGHYLADIARASGGLPPSYAEWISVLHPENVREHDPSSGRLVIDPRFYVEKSDHRVLWNARAPSFTRVAARTATAFAPPKTAMQHAPTALLDQLAATSAPPLPRSALVPSGACSAAARTAELASQLGQLESHIHHLTRLREQQLLSQPNAPPPPSQHSQFASPSPFPTPAAYHRQQPPPHQQQHPQQHHLQQHQPRSQWQAQQQQHQHQQYQQRQNQHQQQQQQQFQPPSAAYPSHQLYQQPLQQPTVIAPDAWSHAPYASSNAPQPQPPRPPTYAPVHNDPFAGL